MTGQTDHDSHPSLSSHVMMAQCCMCGKKNLSTVEGDGGSECELADGRWVCSAQCWDKAASPADHVMGSKPTIAVGTYTICELYAGRTVESDFVFMEPADDLVQLKNLGRLPSKYDVLLALEVIQRANGADLDEWTKGALPSDDISEALAAIKSSRENEDAR